MSNPTSLSYLHGLWCWLTFLQAGSVVVSWISSPFATWATLIGLLSIHLAMNHAAVRAVNMRSLNRQRANIALSHLMAHDKVLSPKEVSAKERIFERDGVLRWSNDRILGRWEIGGTLLNLLRLVAQKSTTSGSLLFSSNDLKTYLDIYERELYILWYDGDKRKAHVVLKEGSTAETQLKAWTHALLLAHDTAEGKDSGGDASVEAPDTLREIRRSLQDNSKAFPEYARRLTAAGWDLGTAAIETRSGTRTHVKSA